MNSELEILKKIWENNGKTYLRLISQQTGFGADYVRYICNCLLKKNQIKPIKGKRDWYKISVQGKKELKLLGIIKPKAPPSRVRAGVSVAEKVIYYFPKKLKIKPAIASRMLDISGGVPPAISKFQEINLRKP